MLHPSLSLSDYLRVVVRGTDNRELDSETTNGNWEDILPLDNDMWTSVSSHSAINTSDVHVLLLEHDDMTSTHTKKTSTKFFKLKMS